VAFNQDLKAIVCKENVYPYFLFYSLLSQSNTILQLVDEASHGTKRLRTEVLEKLNISLPPLAEQCRIAHFFKALDDKIELNRQMNNTLESIAQALFKSWFVDFDPVRAKMEGRQPYGMDAETAELFPDGFEDSELGEIPRGWRVSQIGDEVRVVGGATPSTKEVMYWEGGNIHWATPKDLASLPNAVLLNTERCITESGLQQISSGLLPVGTVLLSSRAPIGYLAIAEIPVAINQGFIALICERELTNHYVLQWLRLNMDTVKSRANGTTFLEISKANFRPIPIAIPPKTILSRFNSQAKVIHQGIVNNLRQSETLSAIRDALLPKLLSGQIRVRDAEKMVESAV
jgi:type I restriction enzyme S subunit